MEDDVDAVGDLTQEVGVSDVTLYNRDRPQRLRCGEVVPPAADEVVDDHDLASAGCGDLLGDCATDHPGAAGDEDAAVGDHRRSSKSIMVPLWSRLREAASSTSRTRTPACPLVNG